MAKRMVTLYIDDASLRQVVTEGGQIKAWATSQLEPGLVEGGVVIKGAEVAAKIRQLLQDQKAKEVVVGVSGLHCLTRPITLPQLPKAMLDEAVKREAKRALPVPLEELYLSWQTIPSKDQKVKVFLVAIPRKTADALLKTLHQAGVGPSFMDVKPLLLARVVRETTAVIVDVQATEFDIIVLADGIPQPIRSVAFAQATLSWPEKLTMIKNDLDRTVTFYNSTNQEKPLASSVPIFAAGDLASQPESCQSLSSEVGHPVLPLPSPLASPEGFTPSSYMANIGLALQKVSSGKSAGPSVIRLNALPPAYQPKPISLANILALPGLIVVAGLVVSLVMLIQSVSADVASIRTELSATDNLVKGKIAQKDKLTASITSLEKQIAQVEASRNSLATALGNLEAQSTGGSRALEETLKDLPDTMKLDSISYAEGVLTASGWAPDEKDILFYLKQLERSGRFAQVAVTSMIKAKEGGVSFSLVGSLQKPGRGVGAITLVITSLPPTVTLASITATGDSLTVKVRAPDENAALAYAQRLEASKAFKEVKVTDMTKNKDGGMDVSLVLKLGG